MLIRTPRYWNVDYPRGESLGWLSFYIFPLINQHHSRPFLHKRRAAISDLWLFDLMEHNFQRIRRYRNVSQWLLVHMLMFNGGKPEFLFIHFRYICLFTISSLAGYNKNQYEVYPCLEIQVNCFCVGIFHDSKGVSYIPTFIDLAIY